MPRVAMAGPARTPAVTAVGAGGGGSTGTGGVVEGGMTLGAQLASATSTAPKAVRRILRRNCLVDAESRTREL